MSNKLLVDSIRKLQFQFRQQWHTNQRFRWMIWSVLYITLFYLSLVVRDWRQEHSDNLEQLQHKSYRLQQLKSQTQWPERLAVEKSLGQKISAKLWTASSPSLAEADLQNALRTLLSSHAAQNMRLRLAPSEDVSIGGQNLIRVTVEAGGNLSASNINHLLKAMADGPKQLLIDRFNYSAQGSGQMSMFVSAYFLITTSTSTAEGADNAAQ